MRRRASLYLRRRSDLVLLTVDAATVAVVLTCIERILDRRMTIAVIWLIALGATTVLTARATGLYRRRVLRPGSRVAGPAFASGLAAATVALAALIASPRGPGLAWAALVFAGTSAGLVANRGVIARCRRALVPFGVALESYAVLGDAPSMRRLVADLTRASGAPFVIVGTVPEGLGAVETAERVARLRVDGLFVPPHLDPAQVGGLARALAGHDVEVLIAPRAFDLDAQVTSVTHLQGIPLLRLGGAAPRRRAERTPAKDRRHTGLAILGTRGIPANYGGFETFAEQLALRFVGDGVPVTVYGRSHFATASKEWRGVTLVTLPTIRTKYLDTVVHTVLSAIHLVLTRGPRDILLCNAANAPVVPFLRLFGCRVVLNVDGLEWRRGKWGVAGRSWYRMGEWLSVRFASVLVTDAEEVRTYYRVRHDTDSVMIPYGAEQLDRGSLPIPAEAPVAPESYALYVSRWERENNPLLVARAHARSDAALGLVLLGHAAYDPDLERDVHAAARTNAVLPGAVYGMGYRGLIVNARCYVHATEVGGTHPALIEAMGAGNLCLVLDTPENREVAGAVAWYWADEDELTKLLDRAFELAPAELGVLREQTKAWAAARYSWSAVAAQYDTLMFGVRPAAPRTSSPTATAPTHQL
jgi:glycosyltransferase involved in cell wall biosynthesis